MPGAPSSRAAASRAAASRDTSPREPSLREAKKHATSRDLAAAAYALARSQGMDGFTIDDVAARAGYSRRTFANYFSGKHEAVVDGFLHRIGLPVDQADLPSDALTSLADVIDVSERVLTRILTADNLAEIRAFGELVESHEALRPFALDGMQRLRRTGPLGELEDRFDPRTLRLLFGATLGLVAAVLESVMHPPGACRPRVPDAAAPSRQARATQPAAVGQGAPAIGQDAPAIAQDAPAVGLDVPPTAQDLADMAAMLARAFDLLRHGFLQA